MNFRSDTLGICLLMFAGALVAWTGIFGPTTPMTLKEWQPLMSAAIALAGGYLVYRGAMAKVYEDRDRERRELDRKKLGLYFRFGFALNQILVELHQVEEKTKYRPLGAANELGAEDIAIAAPPEIAEVWTSLDLLPRKVIPEVHVIRVAFLNLSRILEKMPEGYKLRPLNRYSDTYFKPYLPFLEMLRGACERAVVELNAAIDRLKADG
jgi:hypothetical protein